MKLLCDVSRHSHVGLPGHLLLLVLCVMDFNSCEELVELLRSAACGFVPAPVLLAWAVSQPHGNAPACQEHLLNSCAHNRSLSQKCTFLVARVDLGAGLDTLHGQSTAVCCVPGCPLLAGTLGTQRRAGWCHCPQCSPSLGTPTVLASASREMKGIACLKDFCYVCI